MLCAQLEIVSPHIEIRKGDQMKKLLIQTYRSWIVFLAIVVLVGAYIWQSSDAMPAMVASGFDAAGNAHTMTTRESYRAGVLITAVFVPFCMALLVFVTSGASPNLISIPNRQYWLQPERAGDTQRYIVQWGITFATALCVFMAGMHILMLAANALKPPVLSQSIWALVAVFLLFTGAMIVLIYRKFKTVKLANTNIGGRLQAKKR
jgi:hypothetical protein